MSEIKLPPLPTAYAAIPDLGADLQAYARAAVEADRAERGEPVAWQSRWLNPLDLPDVTELHTAWELVKSKHGEPESEAAATIASRHDRKRNHREAGAEAMNTMITTERLAEIEAAPREASIFKAEAKELADAYRERVPGLRVMKGADGAWLHIEAPSGRKAAISLEALGMQRAGLVGATLLEWADAL